MCQIFRANLEPTSNAQLPKSPRMESLEFRTDPGNFFTLGFLGEGPFLLRLPKSRALVVVASPSPVPRRAGFPL